MTPLSKPTETTLILCSHLYTRRGSFPLRSTLVVKEGAGVGGLLRWGFGDGQQVGAVASQDGGHEAQKGLLDLQLQGVQALAPVELAVGECLLHLALLTAQLST